MSKRTDLAALFKSYKGHYSKLQEAINEVRKSQLLTDEGKRQEIQRLKDEFSTTVENYRNNAFSILDEGISNLSAQWKASITSKLTDGNYQAGLSNVLKMIETGSVTRKEDMQAIVDVYKDDPVAMASIRNMLTELTINDDVKRYNSFNMEQAQSFSEMIPRDNRERNTQLLQQLRGNVDKYINVNSLGGNPRSWNMYNEADAGMSMDGMADFVENRLTDTFELVD